MHHSIIDELCIILGNTSQYLFTLFMLFVLHPKRGWGVSGVNAIKRKSDEREFLQGGSEAGSDAGALALG